MALLVWSPEGTANVLNSAQWFQMTSEFSCGSLLVRPCMTSNSTVLKVASIISPSFSLISPTTNAFCYSRSRLFLQCRTVNWFSFLVWISSLDFKHILTFYLFSPTALYTCPLGRLGQTHIPSSHWFHSAVGHDFHIILCSVQDLWERGQFADNFKTISF